MTTLTKSVVLSREPPSQRQYILTWATGCGAHTLSPAFGRTPMSGYTVPAERPHDGIRFVYSEGKPSVVHPPRRPYQERASYRDRIYEPKAAPSSTERARKTQGMSYLEYPWRLLNLTSLGTSPAGESQDQYSGYSLGSTLSSGSSISVPNSTSRQYTNSDPFSSDIPLANYGTSSSWPYLPWSTSGDTLGDIGAYSAEKLCSQLTFQQIFLT